MEGRRRLGLAAVAAATLLAAGARAEHEAARRLAKRIDVSFVETPLERAVQEVGRLANVAVVVDRSALGEADARYPVSLQLEGTAAREVLDLIAKDAEVGYRLDGHVVLVSSRIAVRAEDIELRSFDVRDITSAATNFAGPDFTHVQAVDAGHYTGPVSLVEAPPELLAPAGSLAELVMYRIRPNEWDAALGTSVEERNGRLVVLHVKEALDEIERLLREFRRTQAIMVRAESDAFLVPTRALDEAADGMVAPGFLAPGERDGFVDLLYEAGGRRLGTARVTCLNNQRVYAFAGVYSSYVSDVDICGASYDPVLSREFEGFAADFRPVVSHDRRFVTVFLELVSRGPAGEAETRSVVTGRSVLTADPGGAEWSVEKAGQEVRASGSSGKATLPPRHAPVRVQLPDSAARHVTMNIQVPDGHTAWFSVPASRPGEEGMSVVLTFRPRVVSAAGQEGGE